MKRCRSIVHSIDVFPLYADWVTTAASEEYNLLDRMQTTTEAKMKELVSATSNINENLETLEKKKAELNPLLDQITDLETSVDELLNTAQLLDDYSKKIGDPLFFPWLFLISSLCDRVKIQRDHYLSSNLRSPPPRLFFDQNTQNFFKLNLNGSADTYMLSNLYRGLNGMYSPSSITSRFEFPLGISAYIAFLSPTNIRTTRRA